MAQKIATAELEDGTVVEESPITGEVNRAACEHYLETGEVPVVNREDGRDAGLAAVYTEGHPLYHHGTGYVDVRRTERERRDGKEVGMLDLENGRVLIEPTTLPQFVPGKAMPTAGEVREHFRSVR